MADLVGSLQIALRAKDDASPILARMGNNLKQLDRDAKQATAPFDQLNKTFGLLNPSTLTLAGGVAVLGAGLKATVGLAANFEQSLANVKASTGATAAEMQLMRQEALRIGADTSKSASEAVAAMGELARSGVSVQDIVGGVARTTVQMAEATGTSVSSMANLLTNALNTFGLSASEADRVANVLVQSANASSIEIGDMAQSLSAVGPVAKLAGLTIEDLASAVGILGNNALKGSDAGTSLKTLLTSLAAPSKDARAEMERLGISLHDANGATRPFRDVIIQLQQALGGATEAQKAQSLVTMFGQDAVRAGTILLKEGVQGWDAYKQSMAGAPTIAQMSADRLNSLNGAVEQLKGELETLGIELGSVAIPLLTNLVKHLNELLGIGRVTVEVAVNFISGAGEQLGLGGKDPVEVLFRMLNLPPPEQIKAAAETLAQPIVDGIAEVRQSYETNTQAMQGSKYAMLDALDLHDAVITLDAQMHDIDLALVQVQNRTRETATATDTASNLWIGLAAAAERVPAPVYTLADALGLSAEQAEKMKNPLKETLSYLDELAGRATAAEMVWTRQGSALDAVAKNAKAMRHELDPKAVDDWALAARNAAEHAGLSAKEMAGVDRALGMIRQGGKSAEQGLKDLDAILKPHTESTRAMGEAYRATAELENNLAKESMNLGGEMRNLASELRKVVDVFMVEMGRVPVSAKESMTLTKDAVRIDLSKEGADAALTYANSMKKEWIVVVDGAGNVVHQVKGQLSTADLSPEGLAAMRSFSAGIQSGENGVATAVGAVVARVSLAGEGLATAGYGHGAAYSAGLASGILANARAVAAAGGHVAGEAVGAAQMVLRTSSPSRVMMEVGQHFSGGFAIGIRNGQGEVVASVRVLSEEALAQAEDAVARFNTVMDNGEVGGLRYAAALGSLTQQVYALNEPIEQAAPAVTRWNNAFAAAPRIIADYRREAEAAARVQATLTASFGSGTTGIIREHEAAIARLKLAIELLNKELRVTDPYSARAAYLKEQIQILEAWSGKEQGAISLLNAEREALEKNRPAWENYAIARNNAMQAAALNAQVGPGAAGVIGQARAAFDAPTVANIERGINELDKLVEDYRKRGLADWQQLGADLHRAFMAGFAEGATDADRDAALAGMRARLAEAEGEVRAAGTLTGETFGMGLSAALTAQSQQERLGSAGVALMSNLTKAATEGGQDAIRAAAEAAATIQSQLARLPEVLRGALGADFKLALDAYVAAPSAETAAQVEAAAARIHNAVSLIPEGFAKLPLPVQSAIQQVRAAVDAGTLTIEQGRERIAAATGLIGNDFRKLPAEARGPLLELARLVATGAMDAAEAAARGAALTNHAVRGLASEIPEVRQAWLEWIAAVRDGRIHIDDIDASANRLSDTLARQEAALRAVAEAQRALAIAERDRNNAAANFNPNATPGGAPHQPAGGGGGDGGADEAMRIEARSLIWRPMVGVLPVPSQATILAVLQEALAGDYYRDALRLATPQTMLSYYRWLQQGLPGSDVEGQLTMRDHIRRLEEDEAAWMQYYRYQADPTLRKQDERDEAKSQGEKMIELLTDIRDLARGGGGITGAHLAAVVEPYLEQRQGRRAETSGRLR